MRVRFAVGLLIVLVVVTSAPAQTVKGDAKPWEEVQAAYARLAKMKSYRMKTSLSEEGLTRTGAGPQAPAPPGSAGSPPSGMRTVTFLTEVVNPDRFHTIVQIGDFTAELIQVGTEARTLITRKGEGDRPAWFPLFRSHARADGRRPGQVAVLPGAGRRHDDGLLRLRRADHHGAAEVRVNSGRWIGES